MALEAGSQDQGTSRVSAGRGATPGPQQLSSPCPLTAEGARGLCGVPRTRVLSPFIRVPPS